jgi:hypothetical protein
MDQDRQVRFAIPPFFLLASLLWGAYVGECDLSPILQPENARELLGVLAAAAVSIVPAGFLIGTISVNVLRILFALSGRSYEAVLDEATLKRIWKQLKSNMTAERARKDQRWTLYAAATFDHELLPPGIHTWLLRRWNSFNVAVHSITAMLLAHVAAYVFGIPQTCYWWSSTAVMSVLLVMTAVAAWRHTMWMIEFQSHRRHDQGDDSSKGGPNRAASPIKAQPSQPNRRRSKPRRRRQGR